MGRRGLVSGTVIVVALAVGGCGTTLPFDASDDGRSPSVTRPTSGTSVAVPGTGAPGPRGVNGFQAGPVDEQTRSGPVFPLTLRRTGGMAEFDDTVVFASNGTIVVSTSAFSGRLCTLTKTQQQQLLVALSTLRLSGPTESTPVDPPSPFDGSEATQPIVISVFDGRQRPVDLLVPSLGEVYGMVESLIADVTLSAPVSARCTTPQPRPLEPAN